MSEVSVAQLVETSEADRKLRAYAYLQASFRSTTSFGRDISDAIDCLLPFVLSGLADQKDQQLDISQLSNFLSEKFSFTIPLYALQQITPRAQNVGALEWDPVHGVHICRDVRSQSKIQSNGLEGDFEQIEQRLGIFAEQYTKSRSPFASNTWADSLITLFKGATSDRAKRVQFNDAYVSDGAALDNYIVARFIQHASDSEQSTYDKILRIFTGVLIEDFLSTIQELGSDEDFSKLNIYYDTTVLLRLLGTSGKLLQTATMEMHRGLQDLGCRTWFFEHNETEIVNILTSLIHQHDSQRTLYGETAEALLRGEFNVSFLREVEATYDKKLSALNVFPAKYSFRNTRTENFYQIDEKKFEGYLSSGALKRGRKYSKENAEADTKSLAIVMRLRRDGNRRNISEAGHIFITTNKLLARLSREFYVREMGFEWIQVPPIMTNEQITTVAWIAGNKDFEKQRVSQELLANCYSAVRPDSEWMPKFLSALEEYKSENPGELNDESTAAIFLHTARRIAQDRSLGNNVVLQTLNTRELFERAHEAIESKRQEAENRGKKEGEREAEERIVSQIRGRANSIANRVTVALKIVLVFVFFASLALPGSYIYGNIDLLTILIQVASAVAVLLSVLDLFGFPIVKQGFAKLQRSIARRIERVLEP